MQTLDKYQTSLIIYLVLFTFVQCGENGTVTVQTKSNHPLRKAWILNNVVGATGLCLNSAVLYLLITERNHLVSTVNVMIG